MRQTAVVDGDPSLAALGVETMADVLEHQDLLARMPIEQGRVEEDRYETDDRAS